MPNLAFSISQERQMAEALLDAMSYALNKQVVNCFTEYPRDPKQRWLYLSSGMDGACQAIGLYVPLSKAEGNDIMDEKQFAMDANNANNQEEVRRGVNAFMAVFSNAMSGE